MKKINLNIDNLIGDNAFIILSAFRKQARREGWTPEEIDVVINEAKLGNYDNLIAVILKYTI